MDTNEPNDIDSIADDIVSQLKNTINSPSIPSNKSITPLNPDDIEQYIVDKSSDLVSQAMEVVGSLKDYVSVGGADAKEISAFAEVVNAATSALESLNKIHQTKERNKTAIHLKEMDIEARKEIAVQDNTTKLVLGREELMRQLIHDSQNIQEQTIIDV
jgi:hypothetical protein